jgi:hypothetical protein
LFHIEKQHGVANANRLATNSNLPAVTRGETSAEVNTYHTFKGKSRNHVILATALVGVKDKTGQ